MTGHVAPAPERVAIVVPCWNEATRITSLLDGIRAQDAPPNHIVVVDTGSKDGTRDLISRYQQRHRDLPLTCLTRRGAGVSAALNAAIEAAQGDIIIRLDGHSCPRPDYVRRALAALRDTGAGVVGGAWDIAPDGATRSAEAIAYAVSHPVGAGNAAYRTAGPDAFRVAVDTVPFGCFRKTTWRALGGFNEALLTNEDYEFNYRVRQGGSKVVLDSRIRCTYFARGTLVGLAHQYFRYGWWKGRMLRQYPRSLRWRQVLPGALWPALAVLVVAALNWPSWRFAPGWLLMAYGGLACVAAIDVARRRHRWDLLWTLPGVFAIVHWAWSLGLGIHLVTVGRWPAASAWTNRDA